jgi:hypothetical protein
MNNILTKILNEVCLSERITNGIFDITNNEHIDVMREYLVNKGIDEGEAIAFTNRVVEGGKHPDRQAYNKNGILVTFPTPQHKQNAIRRGTHFEKDPTKGKGNLWGTSVDTGQPRKGPGRPPKDDKEKDTGEFTSTADGGGQSITPTGDVSSLPVSGTDSETAPDAADTATTSAAPEPDGATATAEPAQSTPLDFHPPKPPDEKEQDKKAIQQMIASKNIALASPLNASPFNTEPKPVAKDVQKDKAAVDVAKLYMQEALKAIERLL